MIYAFEEYELDVPRYELRYAGKLVKLEPQVFNVLAYLLQHRDRVVTKEEILEQLWPGRFVSEGALTSRLTAARRAIGDQGREQRLIHTVHGRGYRFIGTVEERVAEVPSRAVPPVWPLPHHLEVPSGSRTAPELSRRHSSQTLERGPHDLPAAVPTTDNPPHALTAARMVQAVGREAELAQLNHSLQRALRGTRQVVFVTGEAGLGKTTLVEMFLQQFGAAMALWIGRGQCVEHYGSGEAYLVRSKYSKLFLWHSLRLSIRGLHWRASPSRAVHFSSFVTHGHWGSAQTGFLRELRRSTLCRRR